MSELIDTTEMYLKTVFELKELGVTPMRARIAERLSQSGPTVSQTVARMERDGLLFLDEDRVIHLSDEGQRIATDVMRKHRLAERHLIDVIGLEYALVHEEACRWEHVMSLDVEKKIASLLTPPYVDPYGNPIPGLDELGLAPEAGEDAEAGDTQGKDGADGVAPITGLSKGRKGPLSRLVDVKVGADGTDVTVVAIGEVIQSDVAFLGELAAQGVLPGARVRVEDDMDSLVLHAEKGGVITLSPLDASHISVRVSPGV